MRFHKTRTAAKHTSMWPRFPPPLQQRTVGAVLQAVQTTPRPRIPPDWGRGWGFRYQFAQLVEVLHAHAATGGGRGPPLFNAALVGSAASASPVCPPPSVVDPQVNAFLRKLALRVPGFTGDEQKQVADALESFGMEGCVLHRKCCADAHEAGRVSSSVRGGRSASADCESGQMLGG